MTASSVDFTRLLIPSTSKTTAVTTAPITFAAIAVLSPCCAVFAAFSAVTMPLNAPTTLIIIFVTLNAAKPNPIAFSMETSVSPCLTIHFMPSTIAGIISSTNASNASSITSPISSMPESFSISSIALSMRLNPSLTLVVIGSAFLPSSASVSL